jgi:SNF2 family DNA or RNA helicase
MSESICPLITQYTNELGIDPQVLERLYLIRKWDIDPNHPEITPIPFKWPSLLRTKVLNFDTGQEEEPLNIREYQKVQIHHLSRMNRFINGDNVGLGKTIDAIAACCWLKDRLPDIKTVVITTRSTTHQWFDELSRFSNLRPFVMRDIYRGKKSSESRYQQLRDFLMGNKKDVLICKYSSMIGVRKRVEGRFDEDGNPVNNGKERISQEIKTFSEILKEYKDKTILIFDECHRFKSRGTQTRALVMALAKQGRWVWGLTGTVMKNSLDEFYNVASAIGIKPFGSLWDFDEEFCLFRKQYIGRGRHIRVLAGYKNVEKFKQGIRPFYLGRSQRQVKEPLPRLVTIYHPVELDERQKKLLLEDIPSGKFQLPPSLVKVAGEVYEQERDPDNQMTQLSVQQLVANHWALLDPSNEKDFHIKTLSPKEESLLYLLDGDLLGEKVIVFTKYRTFIDRLDWLTKNGHFTSRKFLRITGRENEKQRNESKRLFQSPDSGYDLIVINSAGFEGINLQQAPNMVCLDVPWSFGDMLQLVGRMVRMASPHTVCTLHILPARGTVDEYAIDTLKNKRGVFAKILGGSYTTGLLDNEECLDLDAGSIESAASDNEFRSLLKAHCKKLSLGKFLKGEFLGISSKEDERVMDD